MYNCSKKLSFGVIMKIFHQTHNSQGNYSYNVYIYDNVNYTHHFHKNYEIAYVISGKVLFSVNDRMETLSEGEYAFCLSNEIHSIKTLEGSRVWVGVFSEDFVHEFKKRVGNKIGTDFKFRCRESVQRFLSENLIRTDLDNVLLIKSCLYALCSEYLENVELTERDGRRGMLMSDIVEYIEENYKKPITLKDVAAHLGYDYCYLSKAFNRLFSMPFNDYVNTFRTDNAMALLSSGQMSVTEIALESGFQSIRSFNNVFKKQTNMTPAEFRKSKL